MISHAQFYTKNMLLDGFPYTSEPPFCVNPILFIKNFSAYLDTHVDLIYMPQKLLKESFALLFYFIYYYYYYYFL